MTEDERVARALAYLERALEHDPPYDEMILLELSKYQMILQARRLLKDEPLLNLPMTE